MPASAGTPTILQKIGAALGFGAALGMTPAEITATQAGDQADLTKAEQTIVGLFAPIFNLAETDGLSDLTAFLQAVLGAVPNITSVSQAVNIVKAAATAENGVLSQQVQTLGQTSLTTLVSAALAAVGKVNVPIA